MANMAIIHVENLADGSCEMSRLIASRPCLMTVAIGCSRLFVVKTPWAASPIKSHGASVYECGICDKPWKSSPAVRARTGDG
jgi:hypothetical protein